jgi:hypothetical protein
MKTTIAYGIFFSTLLLTSCGESATGTDAAQTENEMATNYDYYGMPDLPQMNDQGALTVNDMFTAFEKTGAFSGKIKATLSAVCLTAGCWATIENPNGASVRVFFGDHDFFIPTDTPIGTEVFLEGELIEEVTPIDFQKHLLEDELGDAVTQEMLDAITEDIVEFNFIASGILIKKP